MENQCGNCGKYYDSTESVCPDCGTVNPRVLTQPVTIEELLLFAQGHNLPLKDMRFFIGENYAGPRAFGIYRAENGNVVVYKNKADGSRAIRYEGPDEAFAVNEILQKMRAEIQLRRPSGTGGTRVQVQTSPKRLLLLGIIIVFFVAVFLFMDSRTPDRGYYYYDNAYYYWDSGAWYLYDDYYGDWYPASADAMLADHYGDYWVDNSYQDGYGVSDFSQWDNPYSNNDDWDSGDSWDSSFTDWDSDW